MSLFFYLFTCAINLWHWKFLTADLAAVFVNNRHGIQPQGQDFDKKIVFEEVHSKEVDRRIPEKSWTKHGVNKLLRKSCGIQAQLTATKRYHTTTGSFQSHPYFTKK